MTEPQVIVNDPYSWNAFFADKDGNSEQFTVRAATFENFLTRVQQLKAKLADEGYLSAQRRPKNTAPAEPLVSAPTDVASSVPTASPVAVSEPSAPQAPAAPPKGNGQLFHCIKLAFTADTKGLIVAGFHSDQYPDGGKWPEVKYNKGATNEDRVKNILEILKPTGTPWNAEHISPGKYYRVDYDVAWFPSEHKKSSGEPYKDFASVSRHIAE